MHPWFGKRVPTLPLPILVHLVLVGNDTPVLVAEQNRDRTMQSDSVEILDIWVTLRRSLMQSADMVLC